MLGIASNDEFLAELNKLGINNNNKSTIEMIDINHGRPNGKKEIPDTVRALVASEAIAGASPTELASTFNVSKSSISAYKHDATSTTTYHQPNEALKESNDFVRSRIVGPAQQRLIKAIESITDNKLDDTKPQIASAIARDMSSVIKNIQPDPSLVINQNKVVIYRPRLKDSDDYETIEVID